MRDLLIDYYLISPRVFKKMLFESRAVRQKEPPPKESKLKAFLKRSSEPLMGIHISQQVCEPEYRWSFDRNDILENETSFSLPRTPNLSGGQYFSNINAPEKPENSVF